MCIIEKRWKISMMFRIIIKKNSVALIVFMEDTFRRIENQFNFHLDMIRHAILIEHNTFLLFFHNTINMQS